MKVLKVLLAILVTGVLLVGLFGCTQKTSSATTGTQTSTVKKGDVSLTITAAGNLALSETQDLAVDLFYPNGVKGTIGSVNVSLGDSVKIGQVLVTIDKDEWADQLDTLQKTLTTAQRNVTTKSTTATDAERQLASLQRAVTTAQKGVTTAQRLVDSKKMAVTSAEISVMSANSTLNVIADVKKAKDAIDEIKLKLKLSTMGDSSYWVNQRDNLLTSLTQAQAYYNDIVTGTGVTSSTDVALLISQKYLAVQQAQFALVDAQRAVDDAIAAIDTAQQSVEDANYAVTKQQQTQANAKADVDDAKSTLADTQKKVADAQIKSPEIKAPFNGFVTKINVKGGDEVLNGTVAVTIADPNKFEADILVSEMDIMKITVGGDASISLNALTGVKLPAKITQIAPTATIQSGVVNYNVTVEVDSTAASRIQQATQAGPSANTSAQFSAALQQAVQSGRITQAQADALAQGSAAGGLTPAQLATVLQQAVQNGRITQSQADSLSQQAPAGGGFGSRGGLTGGGTQSTGSTGGRSQLPSSVSVPQTFQLKQGLTGTVDLIVSQKNNVLVVPNNAITKSGTQGTVQVVSGNNTTEKRTVQIGLADWQNTEITSGLTEGEKIIMPKSVIPTATTSTTQQRPQAIPFLGR